MHPITSWQHLRIHWCLFILFENHSFFFNLEVSSSVVRRYTLFESAGGLLGSLFYAVDTKKKKRNSGNMANYANVELLIFVAQNIIRRHFCWLFGKTHFIWINCNLNVGFCSPQRSFQESPLLFWYQPSGADLRPSWAVSLFCVPIRFIYLWPQFTSVPLLQPNLASWLLVMAVGYCPRSPDSNWTCVKSPWYI